VSRVVHEAAIAREQEELLMPFALEIQTSP